MQENMKEYLTEKEAREKRLEVYTEKIQEKVLGRSSETIRQLEGFSRGQTPVIVEEGFLWKMVFFWQII